jgi:septal ring factor EnvC (AmiA/AmiB activator)
MCRKLGVLAVVMLTTAAVSADDKPNPDQLKKAYDDALIQLKESQNSKNELAKENDRLSKQVEDLKKQLSLTQHRTQDLEQRAAENDEKSFQLRSFYAAWRAFLQIHPELMIQWQRYLGDDALAVPERSQPLMDFGASMVDNDWLHGRS